MGHLDCILELLLLVCLLHSCLKCLIKLYKLYFVVLCGCSPFGSWCWISELVGAGGQYGGAESLAPEYLSPKIGSVLWRADGGVGGGAAGGRPGGEQEGV